MKLIYLLNKLDNKSKYYKIYRLVCILIFMYLLVYLELILYTNNYNKSYISPCPENGCKVTYKVLKEKKKENDYITGLASYYSIDGCIGCNPNRIMANGERLDDSKLTVAYNRAPLNSFVIIKNNKTGAEVTAKVTDRGGFEKHGKIIDLSVATKNAIGCGDVCSVEVKHI